MDALFNKTVNLLANMLDYRAKRHMVTASNISNMDTDNFKPSEITFKNELNKAQKLGMSTTGPGHIPARQGSAAPGNYEISVSEENVKIDKEMASLAENHLMYNMTVEMLARKFRGLNTVLKETK